MDKNEYFTICNLEKVMYRQYSNFVTKKYVTVLVKISEGLFSGKVVGGKASKWPQ
jgi:hypothetical protein